MVSEEKKALKALLRLLHQGRSMAFEGKSSLELAWYFDELDHLMGLIISWQDDTSAQFGNALQKTCAKYDCSHVFAEFIK